MVLRTGKKTYGSKDITKACQEAFEPYFRDEITIETILNNQSKEEEEK